MVFSSAWRRLCEHYVADCCGDTTTLAGKLCSPLFASSAICAERLRFGIVQHQPGNGLAQTPTREQREAGDSFEYPIMGSMQEYPKMGSDNLKSACWAYFLSKIKIPTGSAVCSSLNI